MVTITVVLLQENADNWLQAMQKSTAAWTLCDQVLHRKYSTESCYMAAQTLRTKIQNNWNELPPHAHTSLRWDKFFKFQA